MTNSSGYEPSSSAVMAARQNDPQALRLLIAQRRLYSRAKRWLGLRWFGMLVIGLAAPVVSIVWPNLTVVTGAIAGVWIFAGRTVLMQAQTSGTAKAAATQEKFDFYVFGMPASVARSIAPTLEEIARISGPDDSIEAIATKEELYDWYPIATANTGTVTVAISQRANAAYTDSLLRTTALVWTSATAIWAILLVVASAVAGLSLLTFIGGILLPVLPAFLDVVEYVLSVRGGARRRADLAQSITTRLDSDNSITSADLRVWQDTHYGLRQSAPQIPDFIYDAKRAKNELAMKLAARSLGRSSQDDQR